MVRSPDFAARFAEATPVLLDGPTGTELERRGVSTQGPGWSAAALLTAPGTLLAIHRDYVTAGADILTANTFRTHPRNLAAIGAAGRARELTQRAVDIARTACAAASRPVWIAGSQAPLGDCYNPDETPDDQALEREHSMLAECLAAAGVDLILVETHPTLREAIAATRAALATGLPVVASFVCSREARLLSGESLETAAKAVTALPVAGVAVNCICSEDGLNAVRVLKSACGNRPVGLYANVGYFTPGEGWRNGAGIDPDFYARQAESWLDAGAHLIGSCCGTGPGHIAALRQLLDRREAAA